MPSLKKVGQKMKHYRVHTGYKKFKKSSKLVLGVRISGHYTVPGAAILNIPIINTVYPKESHFNLPSYVDSKMYDACNHQQKWAVCQATNTIAMLIIS